MDFVSCGKMSKSFFCLVIVAWQWKPSIVKLRHEQRQILDEFVRQKDDLNALVLDYCILFELYSVWVVCVILKKHFFFRQTTNSER